MRILYLTHRVPYPPNRGDRVRSYQVCRTLANHFDVHVVSLAHSDTEMDAAEALRRALPVRVTACRTSPLVNYLRAAVALAGTRPLTHALLDAPGIAGELTRIVDGAPPDVVLSYCSGMARFALEPPLAAFPMVLDFVDIDSAKWAALAETPSLKRRIYRREAKHLGCFEADAARRARACLVVNDRERDTLLAIAPEAQVQIVGNGVELDRMTPPGPPSEAATVVFCGVMNYAPNVDGVLWFVRHVWPAVRMARPEARFRIVGSEPSPAVLKVASAERGVEVTGSVPDVRNYLWDAALSVAPLLTARGVQNKVLEALAAGLPAVITPAVFAGLPAQTHSGCRVAGNADDFAAQTLELLALPGSERRAIAQTARLQSLGWSQQLSILSDVLREAADHSLTPPAH